MHRQAAAAGEAAAALLTGVRPLAAVRPQVRRQAALLAERLPADTAAEWLQAAVHGEPMYPGAAACGEGLAADGTGEGILLQVHSAVSRQVAGFGELLPAGGTLERPAGALARQSVFPEAARRRQLLSADGTCEGALPRRLVHPEVAAGAKRLPAVAAGMRPAAPVYGQPVDTLTAAGGKMASAHGAAERALSTVHAQVSA